MAINLDDIDVSVKYPVNRTAFIEWVFEEGAGVGLPISRAAIIKDLSMMGEFIVTAEDILDNVLLVPNRFIAGLEDVEGAQRRDECEFYYKQPVDD